ncbi:alanine:cation symporter family protein [Megasphaera sp. SW808]|uniref:alanine/glycine:cation symporter family protein n=1 Tax=Megasphaera sp. SW808 TaxID=2530045 RepID=UPI00143A5191|nr:alanine/glycine:cation symporter family protein [Megasphaera sp. SW808]NJE34695.1 alanine:cation symporter family protein [Megasphaera sp. SW808]
MDLLLALDDFMYYPVLIVVLSVAGLIFSAKTGLVQIRMFGESVRVVMEEPVEKGAISSFQALMISTASRVGTGNIIGVSTAVCLGGPGSVFWMWLLAFIGGASAFIESTLAQVYKRRDSQGGSYGGPAYYIETAMHNRTLGVIFAVFLILTYAGGFNMLASYNLQSTFAVYGFYDQTSTPWILGAIIALLVGYCVMGGGKRIVKVTSVMVPVMGAIYILAALFVVLFHIGEIPNVLAMIFADAFDFEAIFGGVAGSCMIYGIKRGLFSNEAGIGSAPNAAASAHVSHPVKQGLVQMLSVFIDTMLVCSATAFLGLCSGVPITEEAAGAVYIQQAATAAYGSFGPMLITFSMVLFAFTTLIDNLFYVDNCINFIHRGEPTKQFMTAFRAVCVVAIFVGAGMSMAAVWAIADILMGFMCLINIPACLILGNVAVKALKDYQRQRAEGKNPVFRAESIGLNLSEVEFWK